MDIAKSYKKQTHREHILSLPDTYIGSIETADEEVFLHEKDTFVSTTIPVNPGFYKLVDELLVNAHDHVIRLRQRGATDCVKHIEVTCDKHSITIKNDGQGIDIAEHPEHHIYIPQLIFGELLTSTNYDKDEKKLVGGKNGYGVKLVNIFARTLNVELVDSTRQLIYRQTFSGNMTAVTPPVIKASKSKAYTTLHWIPDYGRFGFPTPEIPSDMIRLIERRVWDLAMTVGKGVKVTWNGTLIGCRSLDAYAKAYGCPTVVYETVNDRWQIVIADSPTDKLRYLDKQRWNPCRCSDIPSGVSYRRLSGHKEEDQSQTQSRARQPGGIHRESDRKPELYEPDQGDADNQSICVRFVSKAQ
jgi:DNA topoisomerase-2